MRLLRRINGFEVAIWLGLIVLAVGLALWNVSVALVVVGLVLMAAGALAQREKEGGR